MDRPPADRTRASAYLQLLRPANVATALADVLAGAAVAGGGPPRALAGLLCASACLYAGGIVLNDVFDRHLDARERPERPIPSGRIAASHAATLGAGLLAAGIAAAAAAGPTAMLVAAAIAGAVLTYDARAKHHPFLGPVAMGLCRALNLMLGVTIVPAALVVAWPLGLIPLVYIAAVTMISRGEVHGAKRPVAQLGLALVAGVVVVLAGLAWQAAPLEGGQAGRWWALLLAGWLGWRVVPAFWRAAQEPVPATIRHAVRTGVLSLVLVDGVLAASYAGIIYSLAVLAVGLLAWWLARLFAVT